MKLSTISFVLAGMLAFAAISASTLGVNDTQVATKSAVAAAGLAAALGMSVSSGPPWRGW